jgi:prevent-host-death family protein
MSRLITLREANQTFARCIRAVEAGEELVITRNGTPVARLTPITNHRLLTPQQEAAWTRTQARMREGWQVETGTFDRDALHER